jgi:hypothetical protein
MSGETEHGQMYALQKRCEELEAEMTRIGRDLMEIIEQKNAERDIAMSAGEEATKHFQLQLTAEREISKKLYEALKSMSESDTQDGYEAGFMALAEAIAAYEEGR